MPGVDERNKGSIQFLVGEVGSLYNRALMTQENSVDLMHKAVNGLSTWAAPLIIGREDDKANERFFKLWNAIPVKWEDADKKTRPQEDDFGEWRRYKQMEAYSCLFYDHGILSKQDVPFFDAEERRE